MCHSRFRVILAPDSFKGTLNAADAAEAMHVGVSRAMGDAIETVCCPIGDGGEGTLDALVRALNGRIEQRVVHDPLGNPIVAHFGLTDGNRTAVIEMAQASGLMLVPEDQRNPTKTTSYGTGELINAAIERGCQELLVCIGGSATVDGGTGMAQACGFRFFDSNGCEIHEFMNGGLLHRISRIEQPVRSFPPIRVACDVVNPLCGEDGAAVVYGPQKGATPEHVRLLDDGLSHLAAVIGGDPNVPGAGAAGGAGYGLMQLFKANLERGVDLVLNAVRFRERCRNANLVLTGEGRLDAQSLQGKAVMGVAKTARDVGVPTIAIVGSIGSGAERFLVRNGGWLEHIIALAEIAGRERAMRNTAELIADAAERVIRERCT